MKEIMASESTSFNDGVPSFEYDPASFLPQQTLLFKLSKPLEVLTEELCSIYKGKTLTMLEIYEKHNVDTPFIKRNYKEVLRSLLDTEKISAVSPSGKRPKSGTFADSTVVTFI
jgi:hypothetical protein